MKILVEFHYRVRGRQWGGRSLSVFKSDLRAPIEAYFGVLVAELPGGNVRRTSAEQK